jgi:hypothetical protein
VELKGTKVVYDGVAGIVATTVAQNHLCALSE